MRGGSTWLEQALDEHPLIDMHKTRIFVQHFDITKIPQKRNPESLLGLVNEKLIYIPKTAKNIHSNFPETKIVVVLRNPVNRLISGYFLYKSNHIGDKISLHDFIYKHEKGKMNIEIGMYKKQLQSYLKEFDKKQIGVFIFDELENSPQKYIQNIYKFLNVDFNFIPTIINKKKNIGITFDNNIFKKIPLYLKNNKFLRLYRISEKFLSSDNNRELEENKEILNDIRSMYKEKNSGLDEMLDIDTSHWYN